MQDEKKIIQEILAGDKQKYELLVREHNRLLFRTLRGLFANEADVQDLMQETYIIGYQKLAQFKMESKLSTWLVRIALNLSYRKLASLKKETYLSDLSEFSFNKIEAIMEQSADQTHSENDRTLLIKTLEKLIDELGNDSKVVFILREVEGLSIKEISESLGISSENVKVRLHRAKKSLKGALLKDQQLKSIFEFGNWHCDNIVLNVLKKI